MPLTTVHTVESLLPARGLDGRLCLETQGRQTFRKPEGTAKAGPSLSSGQVASRSGQKPKESHSTAILYTCDPG